MLIVNNKALKITNKWLNPVAGSGTDITREYNKLSTKFSTSPADGPFCWCGYYNSINPVYTNAEVQAAVEAIPAAWKAADD